MNEFILTLKCADARGIVASFATGLLELDANIIANKQFTDHATNTFVMRTVFEEDLENPREILDHLATRVRGVRWRTAGSESRRSASRDDPGLQI